MSDFVDDEDDDEEDEEVTAARAQLAKELIEDLARHNISLPGLGDASPGSN